MTVSLDVQIDCSSDWEEMPTAEEFVLWVKAAYQSNRAAQVSIKIVDEQESQALNFQYRHKNQPTNVLSFPMHVGLDEQVELLGDLAICAPVVKREAEEQGKSVTAHWAHMLVHGMLHLQGYDHAEAQQTEVMERLEIEILQKLGFANPY
ncbi:MAG: rRNA maturation RNase YbeY [Gammaproteobacteria bacterium]|nr:rRNA maturation RNase YbeY [Gammaproteobacteria bacterium]